MEQSRLEKIFLQQQREIRNLQREQAITKSGIRTLQKICIKNLSVYVHVVNLDLLAAKEHAERLQHKLEEQLKKSKFTTIK